MCELVILACSCTKFHYNNNYNYIIMLLRLFINSYYTIIHNKYFFEFLKHSAKHSVIDIYYFLITYVFRISFYLE